MPSIYCMLTENNLDCCSMSLKCLLKKSFTGDAENRSSALLSDSGNNFSAVLVGTSKTHGRQWSVCGAV